MSDATGKVRQVIGPVVDVTFGAGGTISNGATDLWLLVFPQCLADYLDLHRLDVGAFDMGDLPVSFPDGDSAQLGNEPARRFVGKGYLYILCRLLDGDQGLFLVEQL